MSSKVRYLNPLWFFIAMFPLGSLGGLGAVLRTGRKPTAVELLSAVINSGLCSMAVAALLWDHWGGEAWPRILGMCALAGLGGNEIINFLISLWQYRLSKGKDGGP